MLYFLSSIYEGWFFYGSESKSKSLFAWFINGLFSISAIADNPKKSDFALPFCSSLLQSSSDSFKSRHPEPIISPIGAVDI